MEEVGSTMSLKGPFSSTKLLFIVDSIESASIGSERTATKSTCNIELGGVYSRPDMKYTRMKSQTDTRLHVYMILR